MRRAMRKRRRELTVCDAAERVVDRYRQANLPTHGVVALYARQGAELDPEPLAHHLSQQGMQIALPVVVAPDAPLGFEVVADVPSGETPTPSTDHTTARFVTPDLIIVPLLAFDERGYRLGQGGGFYDRTLAALRRSPQPPLAIGLAYAAQRVDRVPTDAYDQRLDGVLTEAGFIDISGVG